MTSFHPGQRWSVQSTDFKSPTRGPLRSAYSLLEMIIALAILMALLAIGWSMMGTYANAELRGWKLANRLQTIRAARRWMQTDLRQVAIPPAAGSQSQVPNIRIFWGTSDRFQCRITPSIEPIAMLHASLNVGKTEASAEGFGTTFDSLRANRYEMVQPASPWPADEIDVEYQLENVSKARGSQLGATTMASMDDQPWFRLIRRELADPASVSSNRRQTPATSTLYDSGNPLAERVLTGRDLYRQESTAIDENPYTQRIASIEVLVSARFSYFDGVTWTSQWDSSQRGVPPAAVALSFDFPTVAEQSKARESFTNGEPDDVENSLVSAADAALATQPIAGELTTGERQLRSLSDSHAHHIIVAVTLSSGGSAQSGVSNSRSVNSGNEVPLRNGPGTDGVGP